MLRIAQNLSLQQKMAPQLIQSLQLLQMSTLELELEIQQQMELNPLLEDGVEAAEETEEPEGGRLSPLHLACRHQIKTNQNQFRKQLKL